MYRLDQQFGLEFMIFFQFFIQLYIKQKTHTDAFYLGLALVVVAYHVLIIPSSVWSGIQGK